MRANQHRCDPSSAEACAICIDHAIRSWTGPQEGEIDGDANLTVRVPGDRWPYGPPEAHQNSCNLFAGGLFCDCAASDEGGDSAWGVAL